MCNFLPLKIMNAPDISGFKHTIKLTIVNIHNLCDVYSFSLYILQYRISERKWGQSESWVVFKTDRKLFV